MTDLADFEFSAAVMDSDKATLGRLLRNHYPLCSDEKVLLADFLEGKISRRRGAHPWRATDELRWPERAAVRRAEFYVECIKAAERLRGAPRKGRHGRAIQLAFDHMKKKGYPLPNRESLEIFIRRSKRNKKLAATNSNIWC